MNANMAGQLHLTLECSLADATALWDAAAVRAAEDFDMTPGDVVDTIGPREDPAPEACVLMLLDGLVRRGGVFDSIKIAALAPTVETAPTVPTPLAARAAAIADLQSIRTNRAA